MTVSHFSAIFRKENAEKDTFKNIFIAEQILTVTY